MGVVDQHAILDTVKEGIVFPEDNPAVFVVMQAADESAGTACKAAIQSEGLSVVAQRSAGTDAERTGSRTAALDRDNDESCEAKCCPRSRATS